jgi:acetyl esterase/lipase
MEKAMGGREVLTLSNAQESREQFRIMFTAMGAAMPQASDAIREEVVHITPERYIKIYTPVEAAKKSDKPLPVGLYIHCGGFYAGSVELEDGLCRQIVAGSDIILFSPDYRLAPEHPYPAGMNDVFAAYEWMHENAARFGGDPTRKAVMGGSAGGALTASVAVKYADNPALRAVAAIPAAMGSCHWDVMPEEYKKRLTPERYVDSPMITMESLEKVRGEFVSEGLEMSIVLTCMDRVATSSAR